LFLKGNNNIERSYNAMKRKTITTIILTEDSKVKKIRVTKIDSYSLQSLQHIFLLTIYTIGALITPDKQRAII